MVLWATHALGVKLAIGLCRKKLTSKLPMLETRQASSDEDMLTGDETDSVFDPADVQDVLNEEYAVAFDIPGKTLLTDSAFTSVLPPTPTPSQRQTHRASPLCSPLSPPPSPHPITADPILTKQLGLW